VIYANRVSAAELLWGTPVRSGHSENFIRAFERLLVQAERCDNDGLIADAIRGGTHGRLYRFMIESRGAAQTVQ
jgi:hypothetical protein